MKTDLTFITNEESKSLLDRFGVLIRDTRFFDALVGYFYTSGFYALYRSLEKTEKIRILIGINTDRRAYELMQKSRNPEQTSLQFSHAEVKQQYEQSVVEEMEQSQDSRDVEEGVSKFIEWLRNGKLEIKAYPTQNIHAKLYIMTFLEGDRDIGRVITGSSNFTRGGLVDNLEFNVELKDPGDYNFALTKFNELWKDAVDVREKYLETIKSRTWLNPDITPYELYLKSLYEYFRDELGRSEEVFYKFVPPEFKKLEYQEQAVLNAKKIVYEYGGVFISDVGTSGLESQCREVTEQIDNLTEFIMKGNHSAKVTTLLAQKEEELASIECQLERANAKGCSTAEPIPVSWVRTQVENLKELFDQYPEKTYLLRQEIKKSLIDKVVMRPTLLKSDRRGYVAEVNADPLSLWGTTSTRSLIGHSATGSRTPV